MSRTAPAARFDDVVAGRAVQFRRAERVIQAWHPGEVVGALEAVEQAVADGAWAFGMLAYEAAAGLDPQARVREPRPGLPLVWFGLAAAPEPQPPPLTTAGGFSLAPWRPDWDRERHARRVDAVRTAIAEGETYQVNLTTRLRSRFTGDPFGLYGELAHRQRGAHHAFLDLGGTAVVSASPELFLEREGDLLRTAPMKGTAPRAVDPDADAAARASLLASAKDRAENIMIVDLLRNDLARVCEPGSVQVTELLRAEQYPTVWTLTSRIQGRPVPGTSLAGTMQALFPCGSITGAPKLSTMALIAALEDAPRGAYCGALGWIAPGPVPRAHFNVAIRTVEIDRRTGEAVYGAGGGITWGSTAEGEYEELLVKAEVLPTGTREPFALLETFAVRDGRPRNLELHLERMLDSAAQFGIAAHREDLENAVAETLGEHRAAPAGDTTAPGTDGAASASTAVLMRLALGHDGTLEVTTRPLIEQPGPVRLALDPVRTAFPAGLSAHKTTQREHLAAARARHPDADDVVLRGEHGRAVETTIATLAARIDGIWCTPPLADGCLAGVGRRLALDSGRLEERPLEIEDLRAADQLAVISSARGWRPAELLVS